jgi:hypothetical protein
MLHKTNKLNGYHLMATDGEIGHLDDFLVDEHLAVRCLVVDTSNWIGGKWVLIPPSAITRIDSPNQQIHLNMSRADVERSPSVETADIELVETLPPVLIL